MKITVQLHAANYNKPVESILNKNFGFELTFESDTERNHRILNLEETRQLLDSLENALENYDQALRSI